MRKSEDSALGVPTRPERPWHNMSPTSTSSTCIARCAELVRLVWETGAPAGRVMLVAPQSGWAVEHTQK